MLQTADQWASSYDVMGDDNAVYALYGQAYAGDPKLVRCTRYYGTACIEGHMYFDKNCNRIPLASAPANSCDAGYVSWRASPISLNFAPHSSITQDMTFTQFPLIPGDDKRWFTWKASASHPLLVIDPEHTGLITSPYQLFGTWSFGGKERSLKTTLQTGELPASNDRPWKHGFDALATFDHDSNERIEGEELAPLALWFDENRNGISETGEVRRLGDVGVTKLFYRGSEHDSQLDGYHLKVGFERLTEGKPTTGSSLDWFSPGDTNKDRLIAFELQRNLKEIDSSETQVGHEALLPQSKVDHNASVNGAWEWVSDAGQSQEGAEIGGILTMLAFQNGDLRGMSFSESQYQQPYALNSIVAFNHLTGRATESNQIEFSIRNDQWSLHSTATLSADGLTLRGKTLATKADTKRSFSYTWTAKKK